MIGDANLSDDIEKSKGQTVSFGNDQTIQISGFEKIVSFSTLQNPTQSYLSGNVFLVPFVSRNLLFISQLDKQQMNVLLKNGKCTISDKKDQVIAIDYEDHGSYKLETFGKSHAHITQSLTKEKLWHNRLEPREHQVNV